MACEGPESRAGDGPAREDSDKRRAGDSDGPEIMIMPVITMIAGPPRTGRAVARSRHTALRTAQGRRAGPPDTAGIAGAPHERSPPLRGTLQAIAVTCRDLP
jgi:hypothetical protein